MQKVRAVTGTERMNFLQAKFDDVLFDTKLFNIADRMIEGYNGGLWDYMTSDDGLDFLSLNTDRAEIEVKNIFSGETVSIPKLLAGMIVTSFALCYKLEKDNYPVFALYETYDRLYETIRTECIELNRYDIWMTIMD